MQCEADGPAVVVEATKPLVSYERRGKDSKWRPPQLFENTVAMTGGFSAKSPMLARCIYYRDGTRTWTFVELEKNARWFLQAVGGPGTLKGDLRTVHVMTDIRHAFHVACGETPTTTAVAEPAAVADPEDDIDPMDELDNIVEVDEPNAKSKKKKKQKSKPRGQPKAKAKPPMRSQVEEFAMPLRPVCTGQDRDKHRTICVYRKAVTSDRNNTKLYLRCDGLDWLLSYAADEHAFQGIARPVEDVSVDAGPNEPAVADLRLTYDFAGRAWDARFVAGALAGTHKRFALDALTGEHVSKLRDYSLTDVYLSRATMLQRKQSVRVLMILWCKAIMDDAGAAFETKWCLADVNVDTPHKKKKRRRGPKASDVDDPRPDVAQEAEDDWEFILF